METSRPEPQTESRPPAAPPTSGQAKTPPKKSRRTELLAYLYLALFTLAAGTAYQLLEASGWMVALGAGVFLLEVGLIGFCILADRNSG